MPRFQEAIFDNTIAEERERKAQLDIDFARAIGRAATPEWQDVAGILPFPETETSGFELAKLIAKLNPGVEVHRRADGKSIEFRRR